MNGAGEGPADTVRARRLVERLARLPRPERSEAVRALSEAQRRGFCEWWEAWAHEGQMPPEGNWRVWLIRAGRGFGKTRAGAEWISDYARRAPKARIALVGGCADDVRRVMVEGESGLLAVARSDEETVWWPTSGKVVFSSGAEAFVYAAASPEKLRGPQHDVAWCDELAKWRWADKVWDNLIMGMRLSEKPRVLVTTTPRSVATLRHVMALTDCVETTGRTADNCFLPAGFAQGLIATYGGTRIGRQELDGELFEDVEGALWTRAMLEAARTKEPVPRLVRVVVAVDPPATARGDACGIVAVGLGADEMGYVLADASVARPSPDAWGRAVAECARTWAADRVLAESNQGGEMIRHVLQAADAGLPLSLVHAARGKSERAEPVAALYERGRVRHAGTFTALEDELAGMLIGGGYEGPGKSPDRADALVWAVSELMLRRGVAAVRGL